MRALLVILATFVLSAYQLPPHKDGLFAYPGILSQSKDGREIVVDYKRERDIFGRDAVPRRKAKSRYVSRGVGWRRKARKFTAGGRKRSMYVVGKTRSPRVVVIFVHGRNGNHRLGVNDFTFGGNFNRLQNLMVKGRGRYYSPAFSDFGKRGEAELAAVIERAKREAPNAFLVVACGSMGSKLCWRATRSSGTARSIDGMMILGGLWDDQAVGQADFPIVFGHGGLDDSYPVDRVRGFARALRKAGQDVRFVEFATGVHGTPIRMIDWRGELNWLLSHR